MSVPWGSAHLQFAPGCRPPGLICKGEGARPTANCLEPPRPRGAPGRMCPAQAGTSLLVAKVSASPQNSCSLQT